MSRESKSGRIYTNGKALGEEMRQLIIKDLECYVDKSTGIIARGLLTRVAKKFCVCNSTVKNVWTKYLEDGSFKQRQPSTGRPKKLDDDAVEYIQFLYTEKPTRTASEIKKKLIENTTAGNTSIRTIRRYVRQGLQGGPWTRKKVSRPEKGRFTIENLRYTQAYLDFMQNIDPTKIKFMDESGFKKVTAHRNYGYSERGQRCFEVSRYAPSPNSTLNLIVGVSGVLYCTVIEGASNAAEFINFIAEAVDAHTEDLMPVLQPGDILVCDNCPIHHNMAEQILGDWLHEQGIILVFTPTYSPDFNPAENCFLKIKTLIQQERFQDLVDDNLAVAIYRAASEITFMDTSSFFRNTGYIRI